MKGARSPLPQKGCQRKALAGTDFKCGIGLVVAGDYAFTANQTLLDDEEVLNGAILGLENGVASGKKTQLGVLHQPSQMTLLHQIKGRVAKQKADDALNVLHDRCSAGLGKLVVLVHGLCACCLPPVLRAVPITSIRPW